MKVNIGPYTSWIGPYQLAGSLKKLGVSEEFCDDFGDWLAETWVSDFCVWVETRRNRKVKIRVDPYDVWNMDHTLALIIYPMLMELGRDKHGIPLVDDEDVPPTLRSTEEEKELTLSGGMDTRWEARWDYVLNEIIFAFGSKLDDTWEDQFHTGNIDLQFKKHEDGSVGEMFKGPDNTHEFDREGYIKYADKIQNGFRLFGKYYQGMWT